MCHQSGFYTSKSVQRHTEILGSCKMNGFCPACIELSRNSDNERNMVYIKIHLGHENDIGHLKLTKEDRETLAAKIALNTSIPFNTISMK